VIKGYALNKKETAVAWIQAVEVLVEMRLSADRFVVINDLQ
jgi:hypothetical protein